MGINKKFYWLKLKNDFFTQKEIKKLRRIAGGDTYTVIYLKMQLLSLQDSGKIFYDGIEDTFFEELALDIDEDPKNVEATVLFLKKENLLYFPDHYSLVVNKITSKRNRSASKYRRWRTAVFERDHYTCCSCGIKGTKLNAHHVKCWAYFPKLRFSINNGITLCEQCHKRLHRKEHTL